MHNCYIAIDTWGNIIVSVITEISKCTTLKIKSQKLLTKQKFANPQKFQPSKYSGYTVLVKQIYTIN